MGSTHPDAELAATLDALRMDPAGTASDTHATCRFPARALWLTRQTGEKWPQAACPAWEAWRQKHKADTVGLVFASGYLGNPASFFGHLMIQLSPPSGQTNKPSTSQLLDTSLNFGADVPVTDGLAIYMAKGLLGGYKAKFSNAPFYRNTAIYSEREMRDLWHYELSLPEWERQLLIAHLYEILGQDYEYLFLSQNCASRIARTLELVVDTPLASRRRLWVAPESVIRNVSSAKVGEAPLLQGVHHIPSRRLITENRYLALGSEERLAAQEVWPDTTTQQLMLSAPEYRALPKKRQAAVVDTLASHAAFLRETGKDGNITEIERQLLLERLHLPRGEQNRSSRSPVPIHASTPSSTMRLQGTYNDVLGSGLRATIRPLLYDLLDSSTTRMPNAALEIGTVSLDIVEGSPSLHELKLFDITNLASGMIPLPDTPSFAWHASAGIHRTALDCTDCRDGHVTLLAGKSAPVGKHLAFALAGTRLRTERHATGPLVALVRAGVLTEWSKRQRTLASVDHGEAFKGDRGKRTLWQFEYRYAAGRATDVRIGAQHDEGATEINAGLSWYF